MPEPTETERTARIQIETGLEGSISHRVRIDGRDVSYQVRAVEFVVRGGQPADVRVTYAFPYVTVEGEVAYAAGDEEGPYRG